MNHHVDLKAPAFLYLEAVYKQQAADEKTAGFPFETGSFEEFVSAYVDAHLFDSPEFQRRCRSFLRENWDRLMAERPALKQNIDMIVCRKQMEKEKTREAI